MSRVELTADTYLSCLTHALSTEREEVMGLLLGEVKNDTVHICSLCMMRRSDKQPDRVEISPEQLSAAAIEAEALAEKLRRPIQVAGWYHSHPHITVWPSHVDVRTQADYQMMDPRFIGLIFSCFEEIDKKCSIKVICFQSIPKNIPQPGEPHLHEYVQLSLSIIPTPHDTISPMCLNALTHLLDILFEEEKESFLNNQKHCKDELMLVHNGAVYMQNLSQLLQVVGGPLVQLIEELIHYNKRTISQLHEEKRQLELALNSDNNSDAV